MSELTLTSPEVNIESTAAKANSIIINFRLSTIKVANLRMLPPLIHFLVDMPLYNIIKCRFIQGARTTLI